MTPAIQTSVVFVCIGNFQEYLLVNIDQMLRLGHQNIYVITELGFFQKFHQFLGKISLIDRANLPCTVPFHASTQFDASFRNGFWLLTSMRFFVLYEFMKAFDVSNVVHLENDVLVYENCDALLPHIDRSMVHVPFDCFKRNIASIVFIPNHEKLGDVIRQYDFSKNDMENFVLVRERTERLITHFPIFPTQHAVTDEEKFVSTNSQRFPFLFDAAAMGQYLGGVDPSNITGDTTGFVNETCVIKYDRFQFSWESNGGARKPFITISGEKFPIFNLHIHCKNLKRFSPFLEERMSFDLFDIVTCVGPNDYNIIRQSVEFTKRNVIGYRNIYLVTPDKSLTIDGCITIDEAIFPFNKGDVASYLGSNERNGWYLQQLLKLYAGYVIPGILQTYLVIDSDTHFLKPTRFIDDGGKFLNTTGDEYHLPYFEHMNRLHPSLKKTNALSGIAHHCMFHVPFLDELFSMVQNHHNDATSFWRIFLSNIGKDQVLLSGASEYEIYFTFMCLKHPGEMQTRQLKWLNCGRFDLRNNFDNYDYVSIHHYMRH